MLRHSRYYCQLSCDCVKEKIFTNSNIADFTCASIGTNITSATLEMCCSPGHWPGLQLLHHQYCCPKAWKNKCFVNICGKCRKKYDVQMVAGWFYPKNLSDLFTLNPSASCFAPSAVILLLPKLFKNC